ncbi:hypothetical protein OEZ86_004683 [Tetradesmus obliquus]|nr:hypothetical protein OEZ86_004683 [Tetradesmus obliquus]
MHAKVLGAASLAGGAVVNATAHAHGRTVLTNAQAGALQGATAVLSDVPEVSVKEPVAAAASNRPRVVILGSGWASMSMIKALPENIRKYYDITVISPRNYFLYTPLLPAVAVGTMEEGSITEPVRRILGTKGSYYEASCSSIDPLRKEVVACFPGDAEDCFKVPYDILIMGVGSVNNTFGVPGVREHCQFFKTIEDASRLRKRISECFERAALPNTTEEERQELLSFVICGGGPTGVEVAAEMHDMIFEDLAAHYPQLMPDVRIRVVELMDTVLSTFDRQIGEFTAQQFKRSGIELVLNTRVASVSEGRVSVVDNCGNVFDIPFGACVWSTGIAMSPLAQQLKELFPEEQTHARSVLTDDFMRVLGSNNSIWAFGDAATIAQPHAASRADELFEYADMNGDGKVDLVELARVLRAASKRYPHLAEHAAHLEAKNSRLGQAVCSAATADGSAPCQLKASCPASKTCDLQAHDAMSREEFKALLEKIDSKLRGLPATAQVAKQQGEFLAGALASGRWEARSGQLAMKPQQPPFKYFHKGSLAYVGSDNAVMDIPRVGPLALPPLLGGQAGLLWRSYEVYAQISWGKKLRVAGEFLRTKLFGRNFSNF